MERYRSINDYAIIGDCHTAALVSSAGSVDWYCPRRFDEPAVFCRLLDADKGGYFSLTPTASYSVTRQYRNSTNVLETVFTLGGGAMRLTDLMPVHRRGVARLGYDVGTSFRILRQIEGLAGEVEVELRFKPTPDYARAGAKITLLKGGAIVHQGHLNLALACPGIHLEQDSDGALVGRLAVRQGDRLWVALTAAETPYHAYLALDIGNAQTELAHTVEYWETWSAGCTYRGPYQAEVLRSVLALKLLTYEPTGAIIAAATTSLPEEIGGVRNWDYRFTWLRDAALILYALMSVGYQEEASDFFHWLRVTEEVNPDPVPQIMYTVGSQLDLPEIALDHLEGYRSSRPVRIGNGAADQFQLDIYGEVLTAADLHYRGKNDFEGDAPSAETWAMLHNFVDQAAQRWQDHDRSIWEVRGDPQPFLYSRLMCWAALDRGIRLARAFALPAPVDEWAATRETIREAILTRGYDSQLGAFTQAFGSPALDASALVIPRIGFLPPTDPRVRSTIERIGQDLTHNGLVYRYLTEDGLQGGEGAFALCTFWLVDALALSGQIDEAHDLFESVLGYANDVGLLSEEIEPTSGALLGNFPQGFTHLALIESAVTLAKATREGPEEKLQTDAERVDHARQAAALNYVRQRLYSPAKASGRGSAAPDD